MIRRRELQWLLALAGAMLAGTRTVSAAEDPPPLDLVPVSELEHAPSVTLRNRQISAQLFLPDPVHGFYRGTRFDWAGLIGSLRFRGHDYYVPWFQAISHDVRDVDASNGRVVVSANTAAVGPVEDFNADGGALGYAEAAPGGNFLKIGVGVLRRLDEAPYSSFGAYPIISTGRRSVVVKRDRVEFTQIVADGASGYGYRYLKSIRLLADKPVLLIDHTFRNTGQKLIVTKVYDHNFLNIDGGGTSAGLELTTPFLMSADSPLDPALAVLEGHRLTFQATPAAGQRVVTHLGGFGAGAADYDFTIVDHSHDLSLRITADQPLSSIVLWAIQPVMAVEPYLEFTVLPGHNFRWQYRYQFAAAPLAPR